MYTCDYLSTFFYWHCMHDSVGRFATLPHKVLWERERDHCLVLNVEYYMLQDRSLGTGMTVTFVALACDPTDSGTPINTMQWYL